MIDELAPRLPAESPVELGHAIQMLGVMEHPINQQMDAPQDIAEGETPEPEDVPSRAMTEDNLKALLKMRIENSHQWYGSGKMATKRIEADQFYRGEPLGNEQDGRSQVVSRDVAETVDDAMPSLMRIFASGEEVCSFSPMSAEDEEAAKQATDYINHIFLEENEGFTIFHTWFKDALLKKNGIIKIWHDVRIKKTKENYQGLTEQELAVLKMDNSLQVSNVQAYQDQVIQPDPQTMQPVAVPITFYNCVVTNAKPVKRVMIANVPPDEFIIERRATSIYTAGFLAHRGQRTLSDLVESGYDLNIVRSIPRDGDNDYSSERIRRFNEDDQLPYTTDTISDEAGRKVWITEAYIKCDYDGDGISEWRKVTLAGDAGVSGSIVLENIETDDHPFSDLTPVPEPHKFYGRSLFDQTKDIQEIKTALLRGILDSTYLANSPRIGFVEGQVNLDDLLDVRVGGAVRMKSSGAIQPIPTTMVSVEAMQVIGYIDQVKEKRTGISSMSAGLSDNVLNSSATGADILNNKSMQRLELIARIFAETGVKRAFRRIFQLVCQYQDVPRMVKLRNKWVNVNPRDWKDRMDAVATVGLGLGSRQQQAATAMQMLNLDQTIVQLQGGLNGPFLAPKNIHAKLTKLVEAVGWKTSDPYYLNPDDPASQPPPPPPPQPTPEQQLAAEIVKAQAQKAETETNRKQMELDATVETKRIEYQMKLLDLEMKKLEFTALAGTKLTPNESNISLAGFIDE
jgi:hypothetical protein